MDTVLQEKIAAWIAAHEAEITQELSEWVQIPSMLDKATAAEGKPFGQGVADMLSHAAARAEAMGLRAVNHEGYLLSVTEGEETAEDIAIISHLDVVEVSDGWVYPPFGGTIRDGIVFGRGSSDNKGAAVMSFYLMRCLRDLGVKLRHPLRLVMGGNEETGMADMAYFVKNCIRPKLSLVPDGGYPVNYAQKGVVRAHFRMPLGADVLALSAGVSINAVPGQAVAVLAADADAVRDVIGGMEGIGVSPCENGVQVTATGIPAHAAAPARGRNAIMLLTSALLQLPDLDKKTSAAMAQMLILAGDTEGVPYGIAASDEHTGATTAVISTAHLDGRDVVFTLDTRNSIAMDPFEAADRIRAYAENHGMIVDDVQASKNVWFDVNDPRIQCLLQVWKDTTGRDDPPFTMGGNTYSREVPDAITFGMGGIECEAPDLPAGHGGAHGLDEYLHVSAMTDSIRIFAEAVLRLDALLD